MRNKILIALAIAFLAYILGSRATRIKTVKSESVGHQVVRLWNDPKAKKARAKNAKKLVETGRKNSKNAAKAIRGTAQQSSKSRR
jgi:hypothetical protein